MPTRPQTFRPTHQRVPRQVDRDRGSARQRGYNPSWDQASRAHRRAQPLCVYCQHGVFGEVRATAATLVDHLYPHRRFADVFWERQWWISCCTDCHAAKQALEHGPKSGLDALALRLSLPVLVG